MLENEKWLVLSYGQWSWQQITSPNFHLRLFGQRHFTVDMFSLNILSELLTIICVTFVSIALNFILPSCVYDYKFISILLFEKNNKQTWKTCDHDCLTCDDWDFYINITTKWQVDHVIMWLVILWTIWQQWNSQIGLK